MEITFVGTLKPQLFAAHLPFTLRLTMRFYLTCRRIVMVEKKADSIASYHTQQCIFAHWPCSILRMCSDLMSGLTQKNSFGHLNIIVLDVDVCYSTQSDLPGPLKFILTQWLAVPYSFQTAEWGTAEARAYILKTYPKIWKKKNIYIHTHIYIYIYKYKYIYIYMYV